MEIAMKKMRNFKKLDIWKNVIELTKLVYQLAQKLPSDEKFGLISQLRRSSVSIPSNIAEGASRKSDKDFSRFLMISLGSCYEIETQLLISFDLNFINKEKLEELQNFLNQIIKMMSKFNSTLKV